MRAQETPQPVSGEDGVGMPPSGNKTVQKRGGVLLAGLLDLLLPRYCVLCSAPLRGGSYRWLCPPCARKIPTPQAVCPRCALPFSSELALAHSPAHLCGKCRRGVHRFAKAYSMGLYGGALRELIHHFKYGGKVHLRDDLVTLLLERTGFMAEGGGYDVLVHVPIHQSKVAAREFDQSRVLARELARRTAIPHLAGTLERIRATPAQVGLRQSERRRNVRGAFRVSQPEAIANKRLLLVDDVMTSGATVNECTRVLQRAGATRVEVVTLARVA